MGYPKKTARTVSDFQRLMADIYLVRDKGRGSEWALKRLNGEIGELEAAIRNGRKKDVSAELADVFAWLTSLSNLVGIDLESASYRKYGDGCSKCNQIPCDCPSERI